MTRKDVNTSQIVSVLEEHSAPVMCVDIISSNNLNVLVSGAMDGFVCVWDLKTCNLLHKTDVVKGSVNSMKVSNAKGEYLVTYNYPKCFPKIHWEN